MYYFEEIIRKKEQELSVLKSLENNDFFRSIVKAPPLLNIDSITNGEIDDLLKGFEKIKDRFFTMKEVLNENFFKSLKSEMRDIYTGVSRYSFKNFTLAVDQNFKLEKIIDRDELLSFKFVSDSCSEYFEIITDAYLIRFFDNQYEFTIAEKNYTVFHNKYIKKENGYEYNVKEKSLVYLNDTVDLIDGEFKVSEHDHVLNFNGDVIVKYYKVHCCESAISIPILNKSLIKDEFNLDEQEYDVFLSENFKCHYFNMSHFADIKALYSNNKIDYYAKFLKLFVSDHGCDNEQLDSNKNVILINETMIDPEQIFNPEYIKDYYNLNFKV